MLHIVILCFVKLSLVYSAKNLPSYFPTCYRDSPDTNVCLLKATEQMRPYLQKGIPELSIPPLSPFIIPEVTLNLGSSSLAGKIICKNLTVIGMDSYKFKKFDLNREKLYFETALEMGKTITKYNFIMEGKILAFPIRATGHMHGVIENSSSVLTHQSKLIKKKGIDYLASVKTILKLKFGPAHIVEIKNLRFSGKENQELAKALIVSLEENSAILMEEMRPAVEEIQTKLVEDILLKNIYKIPVDKLLPKSS